MATRGIKKTGWPVVVSGTMVDINVLKKEYEDPGDKPWSERVSMLAGLIKSAKASIVTAQECGAGEAKSLSKELGGWTYRTSHINTILCDPAVWTMTGLVRSYNLPGPQNRTLIIVKLESVENKGGYVWVACSHLTVHTGTTKFSPSYARSARARQYASILAHTAGYRQIILGYDSNDHSGARKAMDRVGWKHVGTDQTDEVAAKSRVVVTSANYVPTNGATDHKTAIIVTFQASSKPSLLV